MRLIYFFVLCFMSSSAFSNDLIVNIDYDMDQDCSTSPICFGFIDFVRSFEINHDANQILVDTFFPSDCEQDGMFSDRFEPGKVVVILNGEPVGTLSHFVYDAGSALITIRTNELNFNCYVF